MYGSSSVKGHATCCCCIPLRLGVFLNAIVTVFGSIVMVFSKHQTESAMRVFGGGYVIQSRVIIGFVEVTGCMWGVLGILGAWHNKASYVKIYNYYQIVRCCCWVLMYFTDLPVLMQCELWVTDIHKALEQQGWNPVMYEIAFSGQCYNERILFIICSTFGFFLFAYLTYVNQLLQDLLDEEPKYLMRIAKDLPNGAFFTQSLGEKASLQVKDQKYSASNVVGTPVRLSSTSH